MTALPLLITAATIAYTVFFPNDKQSPDVPSMSNRSWWSSQDRPLTTVSSSPSPGSFLLGMCVGMSMSWFISYEAKRRRLWETVRLKFLSWLFDGSTAIDASDASRNPQTPSRLVDKFRTPTVMADLKGTPIPRTDSDGTFCGTHLEYLSPDWTLSSGLYVDLLTLPSGSELVPSTAKGLEFYFVIKGSGTYSRNGETFSMSSGFGVICDPGTTRGFLVGRMSSLVLLRVTDCPFSAEQSTARMQHSSLSSAMSLVSASLNKINQMVEESNASRPPSASEPGTLVTRDNVDQ
ncbi:hypothetical protein IV203_036376 [Nitzschia inconspicua]|uniref:Uncharacterized protein n=1 Tax=Nitzschia inconspicua TaxID=303405 RepID=A0A9K3LHY6_9STRA|nr:hypothetical protein IV203_036376 [Nitzschia inconspicua]